MDESLMLRTYVEHGRLEGYWVSRCQIGFVLNVLRITRNGEGRASPGLSNQVQMFPILLQMLEPNIKFDFIDSKRNAKVIAQLKQELRRAKQCMSELDDSMEQQIQSVERFRQQEGARLARDHLWANMHAMWENVNIAKRTRLGEGSGRA
ncbi:hypothetical protein KY285_013048 [Solanum tuberosum]|nr:hypothetical protein KY285_013048 [Solanum tuberosum]